MRLEFFSKIIGKQAKMSRRMTKSVFLVEKVIRMGYRHIDSASDYGNEREVRQVLHRGMSSRKG